MNTSVHPTVYARHSLLALQHPQARQGFIWRQFKLKEPILKTAVSTPLSHGHAQLATWICFTVGWDAMDIVTGPETQQVQVCNVLSHPGVSQQMGKPGKLSSGPPGAWQAAGKGAAA